MDSEKTEETVALLLASSLFLGVTIIIELVLNI
jgi:hypothetical protein